MPSRYHQKVDPDAANNAHAMALELTGWNKRVLELGAASGHVTQVLTERHCDVVAVEREPDAAAELEGVATRVLQGDLDDPRLLDGLPADFDVVLAGDVLEHLVAPEAALRRAARLLVPGGRVVVSLPNVAHADVRFALAQGRWEYRPWGLMDRTHLRFFTRASIVAMLEQAGLVPADVRRVIVPAFESELALDRDTVPTELIDLVLTDPEAETYQFVISAVREDEEHHLRRAHERVSGLEAGLARSSIAAAAARAELDGVRAELIELTNTNEARIEHLAGEWRAQAAELVQRLEAEWQQKMTERERELEAQHQAALAEREQTMAEREQAVADRLQAELQAAQAESEDRAQQLRRVEESVTWQAFQRARRSAFDLAGGQDARPVRALQRTLRWAGRRGVSRGG